MYIMSDPQISETSVSKYVRSGSQLFYIGIAQAYETSLQTDPSSKNNDEKPFVVAVKVDDSVVVVDPTQTESTSHIQETKSKYTIASETRPEVCYQCESTFDSTYKATTFKTQILSEGILQLEASDKYIRMCDNCTEDLLDGVIESVTTDPAFSSFFLAQSI